jgi:predicted nucleic acid-binding protein
MTSTAVRTHCLDASALVKLYIEEQGSDDLRTYLKGQANWYTTPFCFFEALGVLKRKFKSRHPDDRITPEKYRNAGFAMAAEYAARSKHLPDLDFTDPLIFKKVQDLCSKYQALDLSDAFQIISVRDGYYSPMTRDSRTVLITADKDLKTAAEQEGIKVHLLR